MKIYNTMTSICAILSLSASAVLADVAPYTTTQQVLDQQNHGSDMPDRRVLTEKTSKKKGLRGNSNHKQTRSLQDPNTAKLQRLAASEALWKSKAIYSYDYTFDNTGSNNNAIVYPWSLKVRNQVEITATDGNGNQILWEGPQTMEQLFQRIRSAFSDGVKYIEVTYNPSLGYPKDIYIVYNDNTADATYNARISGFQLA